jgi:hypothetical protein
MVCNAQVTCSGVVYSRSADGSSGSSEHDGFAVLPVTPTVPLKTSRGDTWPTPLTTQRFA